MVPPAPAAETVTGVLRPMQFWLEMAARPSTKEVALVEQVIASWFLIGKMGGYNAMNLQVHNAADSDVSYLNYEQGRDDDVFLAHYHELSELQHRGDWIRFR
jgi:Protein of unknown function (DUF3531)